MCLRHLGENWHTGFCPLILPLRTECLWHLGEKTSLVRKSPSGKPQGPRLYYSNDHLGSVGVHLLAPVQNWLESLLGFIGLEAQTLTAPKMSREESRQDHPGEREGFYHLSWYVPWYRCDHWMGSNVQPRLRKPGWYRSYVSLSSLLNIAHRLTQPFQPTKVHPPVAGSCPDGTYPSWCDSWEGNELGTKLYLAALTPGPPWCPPSPHSFRQTSNRLLVPI